MVSDLVKTLRTAPIALLALALVGASCSSANPVALQVGDWQLSNSTLETQMESFAKAYAAATSQEEADSVLRDDGTAARTQLEQNYSSRDATTGQAGESVFGDLDEEYQQNLIEGVAAQAAL